MSGSSTTKQSTNQTQTSAPPTWTLPGLTDVAGQVTSAVGAIPAEHYSGQQVAYMSPEELAAIQGAYGSTAGLANYYTGWMGDQLNTLTTPFDYTTTLPTTSYDVGSQYDVTPAIEAALHPVYQQLTEDILPGIKSSALDAGAYSGDRAMIVLPSMAISDYNDAAARTAATIGYQNYKDYEDRRLAAYDAATKNAIAAYGAESQRGIGTTEANTAQLGAIGDYVNNILHTSASVGDLLKMSSDLGVGVQQQQIDDALAQDKYASYSPFMGLDEASQLLATLSGSWGTQKLNGQTTTTQTTSPGLLDFVKAGVGMAGLVAGIPFGGAASGGGAPIGLMTNTAPGTINNYAAGIFS